VAVKLHARATGFDYLEGHPIKLKTVEYKDGNKVGESERVEIVNVTKVVPPDTGAGIFWLTNRQKKYWKQRVSAEVTGEDGAPLVPEPAPRDMARAVLDILRAATLGGREDDATPTKESKIDELALRGSSAARRNPATATAVGAAVLAPAAGVSASPRATPAPKPKAQLQPGEREVRANGAVISFDLDVGRYAITDAFGRARGYRPTFETAVEMADALPQQPTEMKARDNREPRDAPEITHDAAVERTARRAEPRVLRRPPR
jgi:hypothetical protein